MFEKWGQSIATVGVSIGGMMVGAGAVVDLVKARQDVSTSVQDS